MVPLPDPALVVLVGPSGSGKSAWAADYYRPHEVVSSDLLADRGVKTVFVSLPDLTGPEDVLRLAPVAAAFAGGAW